MEPTRGHPRPTPVCACWLCFGPGVNWILRGEVDTARCGPMWPPPPLMHSGPAWGGLLRSARIDASSNTAIVHTTNSEGLPAPRATQPPRLELPPARSTQLARLQIMGVSAIAMLQPAAAAAPHLRLACRPAAAAARAAGACPSLHRTAGGALSYSSLPQRPQRRAAGCSVQAACSSSSGGSGSGSTVSGCCRLRRCCLLSAAFPQKHAPLGDTSMRSTRAPYP